MQFWFAGTNLLLTWIPERSNKKLRLHFYNNTINESEWSAKSSFILAWFSRPNYLALLHWQIWEQKETKYLAQIQEQTLCEINILPLCLIIPV